MARMPTLLVIVIMVVLNKHNGDTLLVIVIMVVLNKHSGDI